MKVRSGKNLPANDNVLCELDSDDGMFRAVSGVNTKRNGTRTGTSQIANVSHSKCD